MTKGVFFLPIAYPVISNNEPELDTFLANLSVDISEDTKTRINSWLKYIKPRLGVSNLSEIADAIWWGGNDTEEACQHNLVKNAHHITKVGSPTFTAGYGYSNGSTANYLDLNYNAKTQGVRFTVNDASYGFFSYTDAIGSYVDMGARTGTYVNRCSVNLKYSSSYLQYDINSDSPNANINLGDRSTVGMHFIVRRGQFPIFYAHNDKILHETSARESSDIPDMNMYALCRNGEAGAAAPSPRQLGFKFWGKALTIRQIQILWDGFMFYLHGDYTHYPEIFSEFLFNISTLGGTVTNSAQGLAVWNGYGFQFYDTGKVALFDIENETLVDELTLTESQAATTDLHSSNANFGPEFPTGNTQFPALYLTEQYGTGKCCVIDFRLSGSDLSENLIQTISFSGTGYESSVGFKWVIDRENNFIYTIGPVGAFASELLIKKFTLPLLSAGATVTLGDADVIDSFSLASGIAFQSALINDGKLFLLHGGSAYNGKIHVVNFTTKAIEKTFDINTGYETEGIALHNHRLIVSYIGESGRVYKINLRDYDLSME